MLIPVSSRLATSTFIPLMCRKFILVGGLEGLVCKEL